MRLPLLFTALLGAGSLAHGVTSQEAEFFEKSVRPVLADHCIKCHGPEKQKSDLRLDSRDALLKGGENGPAIVAGKPDESDLIKTIRHEGDSKMPEKEPKLPDEQITALSEWVRIGAPWPESEIVKASKPSTNGARHWSFQPIADPAAPEVHGAWGQEPLDRFVLAKQEAAGLQPAPKADRQTLLRRASFDLTGLPPTAAEAHAFENDPAPDAFARVIDRLLASPQYGVRWGRFWLDVARYADTKGYLAGNEERRFAYSYTYRDWVVGALNEDLPYDQFLIEQIAADLAPSKDDPRTLAALGFLTLGRRFLNNQPDIIDDRIDVICRGTMGLTVGCARCHDHKFDPIEQKDYYALYGIFASSLEPKDLPALPDSRDAATTAEYNKQRGELEAKIRDYKSAKQAEMAWVLSTSLGSPVALPPKLVEHELNRLDREELVRLRAKIDGLNAGLLAPPHAMALVDAPQPVSQHVFIRGNPSRPGEEVPRRFITVLSKGEPKPFEHGSGRLDLARAIASRDNPLTARVIVNRVWQHHFGAGLVRTPSDFGTKGEPPTHPELLDWLASRFMEGGWSLKKLHRLILLSSTWQQSSDAAPEAIQRDPENRLITRMNRQRLDFEATRDSLLSVAGKLDPALGGRGVDLLAQPYPVRRTLYGYIDRQNLPGTYRTFDFASPDSTSPQRHVTTVPQQALFLMNSPFVIEQAKTLAATVSTGATPDEQKVEQLYEKILSRRAGSDEVRMGLDFVHASAQSAHAPVWQYGWGGFDGKAVEFHPLKHWTGTVWQGGPALPDADLGFVHLGAAAGHPGRDLQHAVIRRWTAPVDCTVSVRGTLKRADSHGDGVRGRIISSRAGLLSESIAAPAGSSETAVSDIAVHSGDTIDFVVDCIGDDSFDGFAWAPIVDGGQVGRWDAKENFSGPSVDASLTPWERYAQVLLASNEFAFVD